MNAWTWTRGTGVLAAAIMALALGGCDLAGRSINGRVLAGAAPIVTIVDDNDSRLKTPGIEGVEVEVKSMGRAGDAHLVGTATTDKDGKFSVEISDRALLKNSMILTARHGGVPAVREPVLLPGEGRQVLVLMPQVVKPKETK